MRTPLLPGTRRLFRGMAALIILSLFVSCGYTRAGRGVNLPPDIRRIAIPTFRNDTMESGIEALLTEALRRRFLLHHFVELTDVDKADAVVVGVIRTFRNKAISFSRSDYAVEYRATIGARVKLVLPDGTILWRDRKLSQVAEYLSTPDIFETEANKNAAIDEIILKMARDIHDRVFDGFPSP